MKQTSYLCIYAHIFFYSITLFSQFQGGKRKKLAKSDIFLLRKGKDEVEKFFILWQRKIFPQRLAYMIEM